VLRLSGVTKSLPGPKPRVLLRDAQLLLGDGEFVAVMGESGVGKSTLLNLIAGLDRPDAGSIELDGTQLTVLDDDAMTRFRRGSMGFVFQAFHILPHVSVGRNVALPLALNGVAGDETTRRAMGMLDQVGLAERFDSMPRELSGGELQRVAIARALAASPRLVLADEPTGNLDADNATAVLELLRAQVKRLGAMCLMVTHSSAAAGYADRVLAMRDLGLHPLSLPR